MSSTVTLNKTFQIELEDNTTMNVLVCVEVSTEDNDFEASRQIKLVTSDNVLDPIEDLLTQMLSDIEDEDKDEDEDEERYNRGQDTDDDELTPEQLAEAHNPPQFEQEGDTDSWPDIPE